MRLKIKYINDMPELISRDDDSGYDLRACIEESVFIEPFGKKTIQTGILAEIEAESHDFVSYEMQVRPRSGHTSRGIVAQFGTIDKGYRGEISITLFNFNNFKVEILPKERIAQLVICPIFKPKIEKVSQLSESERGDKGFGSSGNI